MAALTARDETSAPDAEPTQTRSASRSEIGRAGMMVVDLSDGFVPNVLPEQPELGELGRPPYAETCRALADIRGARKQPLAGNLPLPPGCHF
jgi:hypothetical protein